MVTRERTGPDKTQQGSILGFFFHCFLPFRERVSHSPGWPGICHVADDFELTVLPNAQILGLQPCPSIFFNTVAQKMDL